MSLVKTVYLATNSFPKSEVYGLTSQIRRSAVSVPSNIAEGANRNSQKEFLQFLAISKGSLAELETQVILSKDLGFLKEENSTGIENEIIELQKMIAVFSKTIKDRI